MRTITFLLIFAGTAFSQARDTASLFGSVSDGAGSTRSPRSRHNNPTRNRSHTHCRHRFNRQFRVRFASSWRTI